MTLRAYPRAFAAAGVLFGAGLLLASAQAKTNALASVGWGGFGNTPDELRHSPLMQITAGNVSQLGRVDSVDFHALDAGVRRGAQSYPVESDGTCT